MVSFWWQPALHIPMTTTASATVILMQTERAALLCVTTNTNPQSVLPYAASSLIIHCWLLALPSKSTNLLGYASSFPASHVNCFMHTSPDQANRATFIWTSKQTLRLIWMKKKRTPCTCALACAGCAVVQAWAVHAGTSTPHVRAK